TYVIRSGLLLNTIYLFPVWLLSPDAELPPHLENLKHTQKTINSTAEKHPAHEGDELDSILVLIWMWPFTHPLTQMSCSLFNITGCHLIGDRSQYAQAHGVMFHHREIHNNWPDLLELSRPPLQKWVWMNMESPANSQKLPGLDNLFNLTANYRRDSDIWVPYGWIVEASNDNKAFKIPKKDKLVCWFIYGGHFDRYQSKQDYFKIISNCKFYLSFENSIYKDYITEKLYNPLTSGTVPVVLGPPRENYEEFVPGNSFIHVVDFRSPEQLADHLKLLDQNQEMYEQYFTWRTHFTAKVSYFGVDHACGICDYISKHKSY
uniref:Fucosyltransferase n=1 Tax=Electrophorus electricus TaxID=8005 RepID=A0A4W4GEE4_ELEEL